LLTAGPSREFVAWNGPNWERLERGGVVSDERPIRSSPKVRATFVRDAETIEIGPDTSIQIQDGASFTTAHNHKGVVGIDAGARNVQHFAVETQFMAAVVKGTAFTVRTDRTGTIVVVTRGNVEVDDRFGTTINLGAGQAISSSDEPISVEAIVAVPKDMPAPPAPAVPPGAAINTPAAAAATASVTSRPGATLGQADAASSPSRQSGSPPEKGSSRGEEKAGPEDRSETSERAEKAEKAQQTDEAEKGEQSEKAEKAEKHDNQKPQGWAHARHGPASAPAGAGIRAHAKSTCRSSVPSSFAVLRRRGVTLGAAR
jgi:hypothetical protein